MYYLIPLSFLIYKVLSYWNSRRSPKGYRKISPSICNRRGPPNRDRYTSRKIPDYLDAIVIGSGIGGLTTAALLSKAGKRVLVLEQHYIAGGCTHTFEDKGYEFETGIHYVGNIDKRKELLKLITNEEIEWESLGEIYDEVIIEDKKYSFLQGQVNWLNYMIYKFPNEADNIKKYLDLVLQVSQKDLFFNLKVLQNIWLARILAWFYCGDYFYYAGRSTLEVVSSITDNLELQAVLMGQFGDAGPSPVDTSFFMHASIVNHYLNGGYYPVGGSSVIADKIIPVIERCGGRVLVSKKVNEILVNTYNEVRGVIMESGEIIYAPVVISDVGIYNTYKKLLHNNIDMDKVLSNIPRTSSFVYLFIGLDGTPEELELKKCNTWIYPSKDYHQMLEDYYKDPLGKNVGMPFFIASGAAKDRDWSQRHPNKATVEVLTMANYDWFQEWSSEKCMNRSDEYLELKNKFRDKMLAEGFLKLYPNLHNRIKYMEVGTSVTLEHYLGTQKGEAYGLDPTPERFTLYPELRPRTKVKGLYLSGQDICTLGFTGSMMGGVLAAHSVLGYGTVMDMVTGRNLIDDLLKLEN